MANFQKFGLSTNNVLVATGFASDGAALAMQGSGYLDVAKRSGLGHRDNDYGWQY